MQTAMSEFTDSQRHKDSSHETHGHGCHINIYGKCDRLLQVSWQFSSHVNPVSGWWHRAYVGSTADVSEKSKYQFSEKSVLL
jgi:hypothetical protein